MNLNFDDTKIKSVHLVMTAIWFCAALLAKATGYSAIAVFILLPVGLLALGLAFTSGTKTIGELKKQLGLG